MEDGIFPSYMSISSDNIEDIEEERRLAYVGITRAKEDLTLTCARQRMLRGETQYNPVSRFVKEIPEELLDEKLPVVKRWISAQEEEVLFGNRQKKYGSGLAGAGGLGSYGRAGTGGGYSQAGGNGYEAVFDKPKAAQEKAKPKAKVAPRRTSAENRPFITGGGVGALKGVDGLSKGLQGSGALDYTVGDRVKHVKYGEGMVMNIEKGPRDYQVTVVFDGAGQKIMYAAFAKLKKL